MMMSVRKGTLEGLTDTGGQPGNCTWQRGFRWIGNWNAMGLSHILYKLCIFLG
jgi:hypothetical protein